MILCAQGLSGMPLRMVERLVTADGQFQLLLSCLPELEGDCILEVFAADHPSSGLDGCWFADAAGVYQSKLAVIEDGCARFDKAALDAGIILFHRIEAAFDFAGDIELVIDRTPRPPHVECYR